MMRILNRMGSIAVACALIVSVTGKVNATVVYDQPFADNGSAAASQNDTGGGNGLFAQVYDNFALGTATSVTDVSWTGAYFNPPTPGTITNWTVEIYADSLGAPGALLNSTSIVGTANETAVFSSFGFPTFTYSATLSTAFAAAAGTTYWLSVYPDLGFPPQWGWAAGTGGDGLAFQDFFGDRSPLDTDLAFTLSSASAVPEPSTLISAGLAGLVGLALRRRAKAAA